MIKSIEIQNINKLIGIVFFCDFNVGFLSDQFSII